MAGGKIPDRDIRFLLKLGMFKNMWITKELPDCLRFENK